MKNILTIDLAPIGRTAITAAKRELARKCVPTTGPIARQNFAGIDGMRALLALAVVAYHMVMWRTGSITFPGLRGVAFDLLANGHEAVNAFIVLSGFCLALPIWKSGEMDAIAFYKRRAWRILPPYYAALLLAVLIGCGAWHAHNGHVGASIGFTIAALVGHLTLTNNIIGNTDRSALGNQEFSPVFWSVAVECQIYLTLPLLVRLWRRFGVLPVAIALCILGSMLQETCYLTKWEGLNGHYWGLFCVGAVASYVICRLPAIAESQSWTRIFLACLAWSIYEKTVWHFAPGWPKAPLWINHDVISGCIAAVAIICATTATPVRQILSWRPLVVVGGAAYTIYLVHYQVIAFMAREQVGNAAVLPSLAAIALTVVVFHMYIEKPAAARAKLC